MRKFTDELKKRCAEHEMNNVILRKTIEIQKKPSVNPRGLSNRLLYYVVQ